MNIGRWENISRYNLPLWIFLYNRALSNYNMILMKLNICALGKLFSIPVLKCESEGQFLLSCSSKINTIIYSNSKI